MKANLQNVIEFTISAYNATLYIDNTDARNRGTAYLNILKEFNAELQPYKTELTGDKDPIIIDEVTGKARLDLIAYNNLKDWSDLTGQGEN